MPALWHISRAIRAPAPVRLHPSMESQREEMEAAMRQLLERGGLAQPDLVLPHEDGGIVCLWHEQMLAVVVDPDEFEPGAERDFPV